MGRWRYAADLLAWAAITAWVSSSGYAYCMGNDDIFQRLGALGIVFGVLYYIASPPPSLHPLGAIKSGAATQKTILIASDAALNANTNVAILAASLCKMLESEGKDVPGSILALAQPVLRGSVVVGTQGLHGQFASNIEELATAQLAADTQAARVERIRAVTQAVLVVVGTLQSGFGSLLVVAP